MRIVILAALSVGLVLSGCATKRYGRAAPLSSVERQSYDCNDIKVELAKVQALEDSIEEGDDFNIASAGAFLADFGIGNKIEKDAAEKSARERRQQLEAVAAEKSCAV